MGTGAKVLMSTLKSAWRALWIGGTFALMLFGVIYLLSQMAN